MKISIYGCGWLGAPLAKHLKTKNHELKVTAQSQSSVSKLKSQGYQVFQSSINELNNLASDFFACDLLIIAVPHKVVADFIDLKKQIEKAKISKVIYISSTSVYQNNNDFVNEQNGPLNPESKILQVEQALTSHNYKLTTVRFAGLIGPNRDPAQFFIKSGRAIGQPNATVNLIHLDDCIGIISKIIELNKYGEIYNGCHPDHPLKKDFYHNAALKSGNKPPALANPDKILFKTVDGSKVTRDLNYTYKVSLV